MAWRARRDAHGEQDSDLRLGDGDEVGDRVSSLGLLLARPAAPPTVTSFDPRPIGDLDRPVDPPIFRGFERPIGDLENLCRGLRAGDPRYFRLMGDLENLWRGLRSRERGDNLLCRGLLTERNENLLR